MHIPESSIERGVFDAQPAQFAMVPHAVIKAVKDAKALALYTVLKMYADHATGLAYPSRRKLAEHLGYTTTKGIDAALKTLEDLGLVRTFARFKGPNGEWATECREGFSQTSNGYILGSTPTPSGHTPYQKNDPTPTPSGYTPHTLAGTPPIPYRGHELYPSELKPSEQENPYRPLAGDRDTFVVESPKNETPTATHTMTPSQTLMEETKPATGNEITLSSPHMATRAAETNKTTNDTKPRRKRHKGDYTPEFEQFWAQWPDKKAKRAAAQAYEGAIERGNGHHAIMAGLNTYNLERASNPRMQRYQVHASTWLNQDRFLDQYAAAPLATKNTAKAMLAEYQTWKNAHNQPAPTTTPTQRELDPTELF